MLEAILLAVSLSLADGGDPYLAGFRDSSSHWQKKRDLFDYPKHDPPTSNPSPRTSYSFNDKMEAGLPTKKSFESSLMRSEPSGKTIAPSSTLHSTTAPLTPTCDISLMRFR